MSSLDISVKWDHKSFDGMVRTLERFEKKVRNKVLRDTVRETGKIFVNELKSSAPKDSGTLKRNIKQKVRTKKNYIYSIFGAKWVGESGTTKGKNPAIYIHVLEHGGKKRSSGTRPFARDAFNRKRAQAVALVKKRMSEAYRKANSL